MSSSDFMLTAEELRLRTLKRRTITIIALALVVVIVAGFFGGRPALNEIKAWQARRHAQRAFACIEMEKWIDARTEAIAAYQLRPTEPQALRALARFLSRTHQPEALDFWKQLAGKTSLTHQDVRDEAMIAIIAGDTSRADAAVRELIGSHAEPADWLLAAQLSIQKNLHDEAKPYLEEIVADPHTTESEQFRATLLQLALAGDNQTERANALTRLKKLAEGKTATSLDALVVLAQNALSIPIEGTPSVPSSASAEATEGLPQIVDLVRALENHPLAKAPHKLLALDLRLRVDPTQREALIARAIADWKDAEPADLVALAVWLNGKGEYQREIDTIPLEKALQSRDLFLQYLDALGALGRWNEIKQLLGSERFPLDPVVQAMYLARCSAQLGEKIPAANNWQRALEAAGGDVPKLMTLAQYADKNENAEIAEAAYNGAAAVSPKLRAAQDGRLRLAQTSRDTKKLHDVLAGMEKLWPDDTAIRNDEAYTRLLLLRPGDQSSKSEAQTIEKAARDLLAREPSSLPHLTLLALALLRQDRAGDALAIYENLNVPKNVLTPSALAVHAATLAATQHRDGAESEAAQVPVDKLLPEERALIQDLLE